MTISEQDGVIVATDWGWGRDQEETPVLLVARDQLQDYFDGLRTGFDLPWRLVGSAYAQRVLTVVSGIPYGFTSLYSEVAALAGGTAAGTGRVLATNPLPILIPTHRVRGRSRLGRFPEEGGGLEAKRYLLALEARVFGKNIKASG